MEDDTAPALETPIVAAQVAAATAVQSLASLVIQAAMPTLLDELTAQAEQFNRTIATMQDTIDSISRRLSDEQEARRQLESHVDVLEMRVRLAVNKANRMEGLIAEDRQYMAEIRDVVNANAAQLEREVESLWRASGERLGEISNLIIRVDDLEDKDTGHDDALTELKDDLVRLGNVANGNALVVARVVNELIERADATNEALTELEARTADLEESTWPAPTPLSPDDEAFELNIAPRWWADYLARADSAPMWLGTALQTAGVVFAGAVTAAASFDAAVAAFSADRLDPNQDHDVDHCEACCSICNPCCVCGHTPVSTVFAVDAARSYDETIPPSPSASCTTALSSLIDSCDRLGHCPTCLFFGFTHCHECGEAL